MEYVIKHNYGSRSFSSKVRRDDRFKKKITVIDGGSDPRIRQSRKAVRRSGGNKGNLFSRIQRTLAVGFCFTLLTASIYMSNAIAKQNNTPGAEAVTAQQDEEPNSTRDSFPREYASADIPRGYVDPSIAEEKSFVDLMINESGFEAGRVNKSSLACGVGQAWPCTKLYPHATKEWILKNKIIKTMPDGTTKWYLPNSDKSSEIQWARDYIKNRYTTAKSALYFWEVTSVEKTGQHWY